MAEAQFGLTRGFVHVPVHEFETVRVVEAATYGVDFEDIKFQKRAGVSGSVHEGTTDAASLMVRVDEDSTYLITHQSQEADDTTIGLVDHCLGHGEPKLGDLTPLGLEKLLGEERVGYQRRPVPDIEQIIEIFINVGSNRHRATLLTPTYTAANDGTSSATS